MSSHVSNAQVVNFEDRTGIENRYDSDVDDVLYEFNVPKMYNLS